MHRRFRLWAVIWVAVCIGAPAAQAQTVLITPKNNVSAPLTRSTQQTVTAQSFGRGLHIETRPVLVGGKQHLVAEHVSAADIVRLRQVADVRIESRVHIAADPLSEDRWTETDTALGVESAWGVSTGEGITVAVVDTGWTNHEDLKGARWTNDKDPVDGIDNDNNGYVDDYYGVSWIDGSSVDGNGHGTHVAGTIAARRNGLGIQGIAPGAKIMPLRALDNNGSGNTIDVAAAVDYAVDNGANIVNLSLSGDQRSVTLENAIARASAAGVIVVIAAGNDGVSLDTQPRYPATNQSPLAVTVGSASLSSGQRSSFSNYSNRYVSFVGDGNRVVSTYLNNGYQSMSGTSMAAPQVAGEFAVIAASARNNTGAQWLATAQAAASHVGGTQSMSRYGVINLNKAVGGPTTPVTNKPTVAPQPQVTVKNIRTQRTKTRLRIRWTLSGTGVSSVTRSVVSVKCGKKTRSYTTRGRSVSTPRYRGTCVIRVRAQTATRATVAVQQVRRAG